MCRSVGTSRRDVRGLGGRSGLSLTPQLWEVPTMAQSMSLVGLDVHASQTHAAILETASGELRGVKLRMAAGQVVEFLLTLPGPVRAVYEAGPTGFGLARVATDRGIDVRVVAAGKVPRASGDRVKTDKRDAERLARLLAAGELRFAFVPSVADEQFRDVIRAIEGLPRRPDARPPPALEDAAATRPALGRTRVGVDAEAHEPAADAALRGRLLARDVRGLPVRRGDARRTARRADRRARTGDPRQPPRPDDRAAALLQGDRHALGRRAVRRARRLAWLPAQAAVGVPRDRPSEHTSDTKRRQGAITKAGPVHARRLLVEAAHHYRHRPAIGDKLARRQHARDPRAIEIAWRAQRRLHQRWQVLAGQRRKPAGVVAIACARELAAFCWQAATLT
jgi:transposase